MQILGQEVGEYNMDISDKQILHFVYGLFQIQFIFEFLKSLHMLSDENI